MHRHTFNLARGLAALALVHGASAAMAAGYPSKPITFIVPYTAGGTTDLVARTAGQKVAEKLGQPSSWKTAPAHPARLRYSWLRAARLPTATC